MGWEVLTVIPEIGFVRSNMRTVPVPDFCDCGTWNGREISGEAEATMVIDIKPTDSGEASFELVFQCILNFKGKNWYGATTRHETYACASNGGIENYFWALLRRIIEAH
jgi:hypothetical protein